MSLGHHGTQFTPTLGHSGSTLSVLTVGEITQLSGQSGEIGGGPILGADGARTQGHSRTTSNALDSRGHPRVSTRLMVLPKVAPSVLKQGQARARTVAHAHSHERLPPSVIR